MKEFDSVSVEVLLAKLRMLGVRGVSGDLLESYLSDRDKRLVSLESFVCQTYR